MGVGTERGYRAAAVSAICLLVCCVLAACEADPPPPPSEVDGESVTAPPATLSDRCSGNPAHGLRTIDVTSAGRSYKVPVYFPDQYTNTRRVPLLLDLHGSASNGVRQLKLSGFDKVAARHDFLLAAPDGGVPFRVRKGKARRYSWNVPGVPLFGGKKVPAGARDDVRFLHDLITQVTAQNCVNPQKVYAAGFSGGARMASALACADAEQISGIIAVSGLRAGWPNAKGNQPVAGSCRPAKPVSVIAFHGTADRNAPYFGGGSKEWRYPVNVALRDWAAFGGCARKGVTYRVSRHVRLLDYPRCAARYGRRTVVEMFTIKGGGHRWPGSDYSTAYASGASTHEISASELVWDYLSDSAS